MFVICPAGSRGKTKQVSPFVIKQSALRVKWCQMVQGFCPDYAQEAPGGGGRCCRGEQS